jgi:hypothetical protein
MEAFHLIIVGLLVVSAYFLYAEMCFTLFANSV